MPCFTRIEYAAEDMKINDLDAFKRVLAKHQWEITSEDGQTIYFRDKIAGTNGRYDKKTGQITLYGEGTQSDYKAGIAQLRQSYAADVVTTAAKRFGWTVRQQGNGQIKITRR